MNPAIVLDCKKSNRSKFHYNCIGPCLVGRCFRLCSPMTWVAPMVGAQTQLWSSMMLASPSSPVVQCRLRWGQVGLLPPRVPALGGGQEQRRWLAVLLPALFTPQGWAVKPASGDTLAPWICTRSWHREVLWPHPHRRQCRSAGEQFFFSPCSL